MVFNDTSNKLGIIQSCERYTSLGDAGISGVTQLLKEFTAHANEISRRVWHRIFMAYGGWQYDDSNQVDLPAATTTLTADQASYALPASALTVRGIEVKDTGGVWHPLLPLNEEQIREHQAMGEFYKTSAQPLYYQLVGSTVRVFPPANYTQASSFKTFFDRGSVAFASSDTTATPGFASEYHNVIAIGASLEWLSYSQPTNPTIKLLKDQYDAFMGVDGRIDLPGTISRFYSARFAQMFPPRITVKDSIREYI